MVALILALAGTQSGKANLPVTTGDAELPKMMRIAPAGQQGWRRLPGAIGPSLVRMDRALNGLRGHQYRSRYLIETVKRERGIVNMLGYIADDLQFRIEVPYIAGDPKSISLETYVGDGWRSARLTTQGWGFHGRVRPRPNVLPSELLPQWPYQVGRVLYTATASRKPGFATLGLELGRARATSMLEQRTVSGVRQQRVLAQYRLNGRQCVLEIVVDPKSGLPLTIRSRRQVGKAHPETALWTAQWKPLPKSAIDPKWFKIPAKTSR
ncbi:MAG: hypothetical protein SFX74_09745 [Fimbriimonadaceae bacterium]|nr:hypothetical protein [Fimbriimonadaceae bacterium]